MPRVAPFRGLRFDPAVAGPVDRLTAPPYDVISGPSRDGLRDRSPYNIVHVDLADETGDPGRRYGLAADRLREWRSRGALVQADEPSYYGYEFRFRLGGAERTLRGVLCGMELEPSGDDVLPHEQTMEAPILDRLRLLRATRTELSPIYGTVAGPSEPLAEALAATAASPPMTTVADEEGVEHRLWAIPAETPIDRWLDPLPLLIADGHHRYATALSYRDERRQAAGRGPWDRVLSLVVDAGTEVVPVLPYHRVQVMGPGPRGGEPVGSLEDLLKQVDDAELRYGTISRDGERVVYRLQQLRGDPPTVRALHDQVLDRVAPGDAVRFTHDARDAERTVLEGHAVAAYVLPPTTPDRVRKVIERGDRLPRKSTFFWPKPRTGMMMMPVG